MSYWKGNHSCDDLTCRNAKDTSLHTDVYVKYCAKCLDKLKQENKCENCGLQQRVGDKLSDSETSYGYENLCMSCNQMKGDMFYRMAEKDQAIEKWHTQRYEINNELSLLNTCRQIPFLSGAAGLLLQYKKNALEEKIASEEKIMNERHTKEYLLAEKVRENERNKLNTINQYISLRKEIEAMPEYQKWRKAVLERDGFACVIDGIKDNLEVDHRFQSLHSILRKHNITNITEAYECADLWDINNGATLCKSCHDRTMSSQTYRKLNP